jgi:hypothetical protein
VKLRLSWNAMALCSFWLAACATTADARALLAEDTVKAEFVLRFASYVEWPENTAPTGNFNIVVLGASQIALRMQALAAGRTVMNRPVQIRRIARIEDVGDAQLLYIGNDRSAGLRDLIARIADRNVLVISDEEDALDSGSTINLRVADQHVRFEVSLPAARQARLRISSELLALAVRVQK